MLKYEYRLVPFASPTHRPTLEDLQADSKKAEIFLNSGGEKGWFFIREGWGCYIFGRIKGQAKNE